MAAAAEKKSVEVTLQKDSSASEGKTKGTNSQSKMNKNAEKPTNAKQSETEEDEEEEGEYEVEQIIGHRIYKGKVVKYEVKWKGYPDEDNTMEAANTLHDDVPDLCIAYWESLTNVTMPTNIPKKNSEKVVEEEPKKKTETAETASKNNNKKRVASAEDEADTTLTKKSRKGGMEHVPKYMVKLGYAFPTTFPAKNTNWDQEVRKICVQASPKDPKTILTYIEWNNEEKTIHEMNEVHTKIPEKLIAYYEERLQFI